MNPIYKFTLCANGGAERQVFPIYKDDLSKDFELQSNQQFYRAKLSGKLTFVRDDYSFIVAQSFDTSFGLKIYISYNGGQTWAEYWAGEFWKTNCTFNDDDQNVTLTPDVKDRYTAVLAGLEKEYNLIDLAPEIVPVKLDKRPMIQVYIPGQSVIGCFLSGMYWEQECTPESNTMHLAQTGDGKLNFALQKTARAVEVTQQGFPEIPDAYYGDPWSDPGMSVFDGEAYEFRHYYFSGSGPSIERFQIVRIVDDQVFWQLEITGQPQQAIPGEFELQPVYGATGNIKIYIHDIQVFARYVCDVDSVLGSPTYELGTDDIVENNRNYTRVIQYNEPGTIQFSSKMTETPTPWGLYKPGLYYDQPFGSWLSGRFFPVSRNAWGGVSVWFSFASYDWSMEESARKPYTLRDAFPLASVISVLLGEIAPNLTHQETAAYSELLYGSNPILHTAQRIMITPKSNVISAGYDRPAQKAPITLKQVLDMLRDCFRCYWFIDDDNRFRLEHISYFMNGGAYPNTPDYPKIGRNLTTEQVTRTGKKWAFCTSEYQFDKPEMAARYQFGWMDDVTQLFDGNPIDIISKYVNPENIEQIDVAQFTSDVDYILLNPGEISKDGFVLLSAALQGGEYKLPYLTITLNNVDHVLQNVYVAFVYLQQYYFYDMPAKVFKYNGVPGQAYGIKKLKMQTLKFPSFTDPKPMQLIKTNLGNGTIQKMSVNLSSRNATATLKYDTE